MCFGVLDWVSPLLLTQYHLRSLEILRGSGLKNQNSKGKCKAKLEFQSGGRQGFKPKKPFRRASTDVVWNNVMCLFIGDLYKFDLHPAVDGLQFECSSNHCKTVMSDSSISS